MVLGYGKTIWKSITGYVQEESLDSIIFPFEIPVFPSINKLERYKYEEDFSQTLVKDNDLGLVTQMILTISEARIRLKNFTREVKKREEEFEMKELDDLNEFL